jgi:uncharacterized protein (DUF2384 family)
MTTLAPVRDRSRHEFADASAPGKPPMELPSQEQSGRTWKFAEIPTRAMQLFGSQAAAEQRLEQPPAGLQLVEDHPGRIEYGVYT